MQIPSSPSPDRRPIAQTTAAPSSPQASEAVPLGRLDETAIAPSSKASLLGKANSLLKQFEQLVTKHLSHHATAPSSGLKAESRSLQRGSQGGKIKLDSVHGKYIKDPGIANNGNPIGYQRYVVFGNLAHFYLKGFDVAGTGLKFKSGEIPISINGLPAGTNGLWAPQVVVKGDQVLLFYAAGKQPPGGIDWPSFRLHMASIPLKDFEAQAASDKPVTFQDHGTLFNDQTSFGGPDHRNFAMIDPNYYEAPNGDAYIAYTVVTPTSPWQEFTRYRKVSPDDPTKPLGPDSPMVDGWSHSEHKGVAEAPDLVTIQGQPYLIVSSRAGDKDQRVLYAPVSSDLGRVSDQDLKPLVSPGGPEWSSNAVGSTGTAVIDGKPYMIYQGMNKDGSFSLGWTDLNVGAPPTKKP